MGKNNSEDLGGPWGGLRHLGVALKCSEAGDVWAPRVGFVGLFPSLPPPQTIKSGSGRRPPEAFLQNA